jgi:hypothetical protein
MRALLLLAIAVTSAAWVAVAQAEEEGKSVSDCLDIVDKYIKVLTGVLSEPKPNGACALAKWGKSRHEEILRMYSQEPDWCRKSDIGKNLEKTLKVRVSQEDRASKRDCRRN